MHSFAKRDNNIGAKKASCLHTKTGCQENFAWIHPRRKRQLIKSWNWGFRLYIMNPLGVWILQIQNPAFSALINEKRKMKNLKICFLTDLRLRPEVDYNKTITIVVHLLPCRLHWSSSILVNEIRSIISTTANEPSILPTSSESTIATWLSKKPRNTGHVRHVIWWGWTSRLQRPSKNKQHTWNQTLSNVRFLTATGYTFLAAAKKSHL